MQADSACYVCKIASIDVQHFCMGDCNHGGTDYIHHFNILSSYYFCCKSTEVVTPTAMQTPRVLQRVARRLEILYRKPCYMLF